MQVDITNGDIVIDAALLGGLLGITAAEVPALLRTRAITSMCERGIDAHRGEYRLSFFYRNRRARLSVDAQGRVLRRSVVDYGEPAMPRALRRTASI